MDFLSQTFTLWNYYYMFKYVYDTIGINYFKGFKNKLPPIRYIGLDENNNELVILAHPKDFNKHVHLLKIGLNEAIKKQNESEITIRIEDIKDEILEIYPSTTQLNEIPNGFSGIFVNELGMKLILDEFHENDEVANVNFIQVSDIGIEHKDIKLCGVSESFIRKFNTKDSLKNKYKDLYLVIGEMKDINIITGETIPTNKYNIVGGKRAYNENSIESTIRETTEELGLDIESSKIYKIVNKLIPLTKDIIRCTSFNVYCIYICPKKDSDYELFINK